MRGYGGTDQPKSIGAYTLSDLVGDLVGLVDALGEKTAIIVGHDWGAPIAYFTALFRPDVFTACAILSVPYLPPSIWGPLPDGVTMNDVMKMQAGGRNYYRLFFQVRFGRVVPSSLSSTRRSVPSSSSTLTPARPLQGTRRRRSRPRKGR